MMDPVVLDKSALLTKERFTSENSSATENVILRVVDEDLHIKITMEVTQADIALAKDGLLQRKFDAMVECLRVLQGVM